MTAYPTATYLPPDPQAIRQLVFQSCQQFAQENQEFANPTIRSDFTAFLTFVSDKLAKYLSQGHADHLLHDYHPPLKKGTAYGRQQ